MEYSIKILDVNGNVIGKKMTASATDVMTYLNKGFIVVDIHTDEPITEDQVANTLGVSDGLITV